MFQIECTIAAPSLRHSAAMILLTGILTLDGGTMKAVAKDRHKPSKCLKIDESIGIECTLQHWRLCQTFNVQATKKNRKTQCINNLDVTRNERYSTLKSNAITDIFFCCFFVWNTFIFFQSHCVVHRPQVHRPFKMEIYSPTVITNYLVKSVLNMVLCSHGFLCFDAFFAL